MNQTNYLLIFMLVLIFNSAEAKEKHVYTNKLTCEYKKAPLGIGTPKPRLSWKIYSEENNQEQTAYQVLVASSPKLLKPGRADLWDSQKVRSNQSVLVEYAGKNLVSRQGCFWTVRIWDKDNKATAWSEPAYFEMGLLGLSDWQADWIKTAIVFHKYSYPSPLFRKDFTVPQKVKSARLYCTSRGLYEFYLNGIKVGDQHFTPGWTSFEKRLQYQVYDVTEMFKPGENAAGIMLGNGWYRAFLPNSDQARIVNDLEVLAQLEIEFTNGTKQIIKTDSSWKSSTGAVLKSEIYNGEIYDARLEQAGWCDSGFDDSAWKGVVSSQRDKKNLVSSVSEPVRSVVELDPIAIIYTPEGDTVIDMGQNMVGWCRLQVDCPEGTTIKLRHAEVLDQKGNFYMANLRAAKQEIIYTCRGGGPEIYEPHFTFQGFRYVSISGYPKPITRDIVKGVVVHSDLECTGTFRCNNELINQLQHNIVWGQKGNFLDVPTDCPQRDERLGWTGDAQVFASTSCFNMQSAGFWTKWLYDLDADQHEDGVVPHVIPNATPSEKGGSSGWCDAAVIVPWTLYQSYGDTRILEEQYSSMKLWVEYMRKEAGESNLYMPKVGQFGDWLCYSNPKSANIPGAFTDMEFISVVYYFHAVDIMQQTAGILGKKSEAADYKILKGKIREAFINEFVTPTGRLSPNTQTAYVRALAFNLLTGDLAKKAAAHLAEDVRKFKHLTTGFLGTADLCPVLSKYGYIDEAYRLLFREKYPSWLYPVTKGATTIWERWDGIKADGSFQNPEMNSFNHYAYGAIGNWLYKDVAGINSSDCATGYKRIIIRPCPGNEMNDVKASHESLYGAIVSQWKKDGDRISLFIEIPVNTFAEVYIPSTGDSFTMNGQSETAEEKIKKDGFPYHYLKTEVGSGKYVFETAFVPVKNKEDKK